MAERPTGSWCQLVSHLRSWCRLLPDSEAVGLLCKPKLSFFLLLFFSLLKLCVLGRSLLIPQLSKSMLLKDSECY